jgi:hypothetical protein
MAVPATVLFEEIEGVAPGNPNPIELVLVLVKSGSPFVMGIDTKVLFWPM